LSLGCSKKPELEVIDVSVKEVSSFTATIDAKLNTHYNSIYEVGVCLSKSPNPTLSDIRHARTYFWKRPDFTVRINDLEPNTLYYLRAYAEYKKGFVFSKEITLSSQLSVGDEYGGGVVACLFRPGDPGYVFNEFHGLIAIDSIMPEARWSSQAMNSVLLGETDTGFGSGLMNSQKLVSLLAGNESVAAQECMNLNYKGYQDWFLPSYGEALRMRFFSRTSVEYDFWTSSEKNAQDAYTMRTRVFQSQNSLLPGRDSRVLRLISLQSADFKWSRVQAFTLVPFSATKAQ
jgi:hypothetical protein